MEKESGITQIGSPTTLNFFVGGEGGGRKRKEERLGISHVHHFVFDPFFHVIIFIFNFFLGCCCSLITYTQIFCYELDLENSIFFFFAIFSFSKLSPSFQTQVKFTHKNFACSYFFI